MQKRDMRHIYTIIVIITVISFCFSFSIKSKREIFDFMKVRLNDKIPFQTTITNLIEVLGKPDSVVRTRHECGAGDAYGHEFMDTYYFKGSTFLTFEKKAF